MFQGSTLSDIDHWLVWAQISLGIFTAVSVLYRKQDPVACLGWLLSTALFPLVTSFFYLIGGLNPYESYARRKRRSAEFARSRYGLRPGRVSLTAIRNPPQDDFPGFANISHWVSRQAGVSWCRDGGVDLLINASTIYPAFEAEILQAKSWILVQFYQIIPDRVGRRFLDLLAEKAREGVAVYVLFDAMGSYRMTEAVLRRWTSQGVKITNFLAMHPLKRRFQINWRNHRKLIVVDGRVAFVGGINIGETYLDVQQEGGIPWQDCAFRLNGPQIIERLAEGFSEDWHFATGTLPELAPVAPPIQASKTLNAINHIVSGPNEPSMAFHTAVLGVLQESTTRVWIATPYFVPDRSLLQALRQAVTRGVDVQLLIPKASNHPITDFCSSSYRNELVEIGVRVSLYLPGVTHAKLVLADEDVVIAGSSNMDYRSFILNFELDLILRSRETARKVEAFFVTAFSKSRTLEREAFKASQVHLVFMRRIMRLFSPIM